MTDGPGREAFADEATRRDWVLHRNLVAFTLHDPADARREVDLCADLPIVDDDD